jgi:hypothetical protein
MFFPFQIYIPVLIPAALIIIFVAVLFRKLDRMGEALDRVVWSIAAGKRNGNSEGVPEDHSEIISKCESEDMRVE